MFGVRVQPKTCTIRPGGRILAFRLLSQITKVLTLRHIDQIWPGLMSLERMLRKNYGQILGVDC